MSGPRAISTTSRRELSSSVFFLQGKAPKEIHAILTKISFFSFMVGLRTYQHPCILDTDCFGKQATDKKETRHGKIVIFLSYYM